MSEPKNVIYLDALRPGDPAALCGKCSHGVFEQTSPDGPWRCAQCGEQRCTAAAAARGVAQLAAKPTLVWRCKCACVLWRVGPAGLECSVCLEQVSFETLFDGGRK